MNPWGCGRGHSKPKEEKTVRVSVWQEEND